MRTVMLSIRVTTAAAAAAAAALLAGTVLTAASAASAPIASPTGGPGHWSQVTSGNDTLADIGLARGSHGVLNVIWASGLTSGHGKIMDTPISSGGTVGHPATVASGYALLTYPDATAANGRIDALRNGIKSNTGPQGTFESTRLASGGSWSPPSNVPPLPAIPFTSSSVSTTTGSDGKAWVAFSGTDSLTVDHLGHPERELPPTACCVYNTGLAVDGSSGATWLAYQSLIPKHQGIYAQPLAQNGKASGPRTLLPGSVTHGGTDIVNQRIGITGRGHGRSGVYVTYQTGYPFGLGVDLLRLGTRKAVKLASTNISDGFAGATVTADPNGGLWVAWYTGDGARPSLFVRQSNNSVRTFGRSVRVALPAGTTVVLKVYISAQASRLDVLALLTRHKKTAYWATQVR